MRAIQRTLSANLANFSEFHASATRCTRGIHLGVKGDSYCPEGMDTTRLHPVDQRTADRSAEAAGFLDTLRAEQARFLEAVAHARSLLGHESGQLANIAAVHGRLTRQFFDAQRTIMCRRAELDAEVAAVGQVAQERAAIMVADARERVATGSSVDRSPAALVAVGDGECSDVLARGGRSTRQQIADLGVTVVRTMDDVESLAKVINGAFELDEADGVAAQRQLTELLDDWWRAELQEGRAVIDDAHARAAVRQHVAGIEAAQILEAARPVGEALVLDAPAIDSAPATLLPRHVSDALDAAESGNLESLLDHLTDTLDLSPEDVLRSDDDDCEVIIRFEPAPLAPASPPSGSAEAFQHFWAHDPTPPVRRSTTTGWFPTHVVAPMTAATSLLALLFAWIG